MGDRIGAGQDGEVTGVTIWTLVGSEAGFGGLGEALGGLGATWRLVEQPRAVPGNADAVIVDLRVRRGPQALGPFTGELGPAVIAIAAADDRAAQSLARAHGCLDCWIPELDGPELPHRLATALRIVGLRAEMVRRNRLFDRLAALQGGHWQPASAPPPRIRLLGPPAAWQVSVHTAFVGSRVDLVYATDRADPSAEITLEADGTADDRRSGGVVRVGMAEASSPTATLLDRIDTCLPVDLFRMRIGLWLELARMRHRLLEPFGRDHVPIGIDPPSRAFAPIWLDLRLEEQPGEAMAAAALELPEQAAAGVLDRARAMAELVATLRHRLRPDDAIVRVDERRLALLLRRDTAIPTADVLHRLLAGCTTIHPRATLSDSPSVDLPVNVGRAIRDLDVESRRIA